MAIILNISLKKEAVLYVLTETRTHEKFGNNVSAYIQWLISQDKARHGTEAERKEQ